MKKLFFIIGLVGLVSLSVSGQKKRELTTQVSIDYTLPKISYDVVVTMECTRLIPGPFRQYAEQQLGISPEITSEGEEWTIKNIKFIPRALPDPKASYTVNAVGEYNSILLNVTPEGFLAGLLTKISFTRKRRKVWVQALITCISVFAPLKRKYLTPISRR